MGHDTVSGIVLAIMQLAQSCSKSFISWNTFGGYLVNGIIRRVIWLTDFCWQSCDERNHVCNDSFHAIPVAATCFTESGG